MDTHKSGCTYLFFYYKGRIYVQTVEGGQGEKVYPKALVSSYVIDKERHKKSKAFLIGTTKDYLKGLERFLRKAKSHRVTHDNHGVLFFTKTSIDFILNKERQWEQKKPKYDQVCRRLYVFGLLVKLGYYPLDYDYVDSFKYGSDTEEIPMFKTGFYTRSVVYGLNTMHSIKKGGLRVFRFNGGKDISIKDSNITVPSFPNYKQDVGDVVILTLEDALMQLRRDKSFNKLDLDYELMLKTARMFIQNLPSDKQRTLRFLEEARENIYSNL